MLRLEVKRAQNRDRKATSRAKQTNEKKAEERGKSKKAMAKKRSEATPEEKAENRIKAAESMRKFRKGLTKKELAKRQECEQKRRAEKIQNESGEERVRRLAKDNERKKKKRKDMKN